MEDDAMTEGVSLAHVHTREIACTCTCGPCGWKHFEIVGDRCYCDHPDPEPQPFIYNTIQSFALQAIPDEPWT